MSQYLEALRQAMVIYPVIVVLFTVPYIAWSYHKYGSVLSLRVLIVYSFLLLNLSDKNFFQVAFLHGFIFCHTKKFKHIGVSNDVGKETVHTAWPPDASPHPTQICHRIEGLW